MSTKLKREVGSEPPKQPQWPDAGRGWPDFLTELVKLVAESPWRKNINIFSYFILLAFLLWLLDGAPGHRLNRSCRRSVVSIVPASFTPTQCFKTRGIACPRTLLSGL